MILNANKYIDLLQYSPSEVDSSNKGNFTGIYKRNSIYSYDEC